MKEALWYSKSGNGKVRCELCPHRCILAEERRGVCEAREHRDGRLITLNYRIFSSINADPVEKKPLYHYYPGQRILSVGSFGCNLRCRFCQNHEISQLPSGFVFRGSRADPAAIADQAAALPLNIGVAYTYNEPVVSFETVIETARIVHRKKMKNVMVTNGYINPDPLKELLEVTDAFNVDLKAFDEGFYRQQTASRLAPVKETLQRIRKAGRHLEITNLVIPGLNDTDNTFHQMVRWISSELGRQTPLHLSRYFPRHHATLPPTPEKTLLRLFEIARVELDFVYIGNLYTTMGQDTRCPNCQTVLISRTGYNTSLSGLREDGTCKGCGEKADYVIMKKNG